MRGGSVRGVYIDWNGQLCLGDTFACVRMSEKRKIVRLFLGKALDGCCQGYWKEDEASVAFIC